MNRAEPGNEVFLLPIDMCYSLVGELRLRWQGFDGGAEAHAALAAFLAGPAAAGRASCSPGSANVADLIFGCTGASAERYAATPTLSFQLTITERTGVRVHAIALRCQIRIEPHRRRYSAAEAERLHDLFGDTSRWADTVKPIQLATVTTMVPAFTALTEIEVQMPCTYDLEVASARYLQALDDGTIPLLLLFSGTVFLAQSSGFSVELVPWSAEASYRMPVSVWHDLVDPHFPGSAWLRCSRETLDALSAYKAEHALPTWDATLGALLAEAARRRAGARAGPRRRDGGDERDEPRLRPGNGRRGPVRGLHPVSVPGLRAEEPEPLAVRRGDGARVRGGRPVRDQLHPGRVRARAQRAADRPGPLGSCRSSGGPGTGTARCRVWDEAVEHEVAVRGRRRAARRRVTQEFTVEGGEEREEDVVRRREPLAGAVSRSGGRGARPVARRLAAGPRGEPNGPRLRAPAPETRRCRRRWSPRT